MKIRLGFDKFRDKDLPPEEYASYTGAHKEELPNANAEDEALKKLREMKNPLRIGSIVKHKKESREIKHLYTSGNHVVAQLDNGEQIVIV